MAHCSRRQFLVGTAAGLAAVRGGILKAADIAGGQKPSPMAIAKWSGSVQGLSNSRIDEAAGKLARRAVEALGGMKRFVKPGETVWVKPNIGWDRAPELAVNTNPEVVAQVVKMCLEAGARTVKVGDNSVNPAAQTYVTSGIAAAAEKAGAKVVFVDRTRFKMVDIKGSVIKELPLYPEMLETDVFISVPVVKHHNLCKLTMCMKNLMGFTDKRKIFHQDIGGCLADLCRYLQPKVRLHVLDGVRILKAHGPSGGKPEDVETKMMVAAGVDMVALDAWGAELSGQKPADIVTIAKGQEVGLGKMDFRSLSPSEVVAA